MEDNAKDGTERLPTAEGAVLDEDADEELENIDPTARMIVTTYDPILVSCHSDALIQFWNMKVLVRQEIKMSNNLKSSCGNKYSCGILCGKIRYQFHRGAKNKNLLTMKFLA